MIDIFCILLFHYLITKSILSWWNTHYLRPLPSEESKQDD